MSLRWEWPEASEHPTYGWQGDGTQTYVHPVTTVLIHATVAVGINHLTEKTIEAFIDRVALWEHHLGGLLHEEGPDGWVQRNVTDEEIRAHLGLRTNAAPMGKRAFDQHLQDAQSVT